MSLILLFKLRDHKLDEKELKCFIKVTLSSKCDVTSSPQVSLRLNWFFL